VGRHPAIHRDDRDRNPLHDDEEVARRSRFGRVIVQGGVTSPAECGCRRGYARIRHELATRITNQDGLVVLDGTAVVWRDPVVATATAG
jgi:acyl dehydratase